MTKGSEKKLTSEQLLNLVMAIFSTFMLGFLLSSFFGEQISNFLGIDLFLWRIVLYFLLASYLTANFVMVFVFHRPEKKPKKIPSTPYHLIFHHHKHSRLGSIACIACIVSLIPILLSMQDVEVIKVSELREITITDSTPNVVRLVFLIYVFSTFPFIISYYRTKDILERPVIRQYRKIGQTTVKTSDDVFLNDLLTTLSSKIGLEKAPDVLVSKEDIRPLVLGKRGKESVVIISENHLKSLRRPELETLLTHELWHAKADIEPRFLAQVEGEYVTWYFLGMVTLFLGAFLGVLSLAFATSTIPWPFRIIVSEWWPVPVFIFGNPIAFILSALPQFFSGLVFLSSMEFGTNIFSYAGFSPEQQEYYVDSMAALTCENPRALISAIMEDLRLLGTFKEKLLNESIESPEFSLNLADYRKILEPALLKDRPGVIRNRIKQIRLIKRLLDEHMVLHLRKKITRFSSFGLFGLNIRFYFSPFVRALSKLDENTIQNVYDYAKQNSRRFNLRQCAKSTKLTLTDTFVVFATLVMAGIVE